MDIREYFENTKGRGVLATADNEGRVDAAVFARPHIMDDEIVGFIMPDRLTHHNLQSNGYATYLFMEDGPGYNGVRLFLNKIKEEQDSELLFSIRRRKYGGQTGENNPRFLVFFKVEKTLPLIGGNLNS